MHKTNIELQTSKCKKNSCILMLLTELSTLHVKLIRGCVKQVSCPPWPGKLVVQLKTDPSCHLGSSLKCSSRLCLSWVNITFLSGTLDVYRLAGIS